MVIDVLDLYRILFANAGSSIGVCYASMVEIATGFDDSTDNIFPCRVRLIEGQDVSRSLWLHFQHKANADRFIDTLQQILPVYC